MLVTTWRPDLFHPGERIPRRVVTIPRDQQQLLDRPDAWSRRGIPNVPPSVLEGVKKFHTLKQAAEPVRPSAEHQTKENLQADNDSDSEEDGSEISWESSPSEHRYAPALAKASKALVDRIAANSSPTRTRKQNPVNSESEPARLPRQAQARFSLPLNQPVSSLASADDTLEVEVPKAVAPLRTAASEAIGIPLEPTPPSAQVIIPSTYTDATQEGPAKPPQPIRKRLMKDPNKAWSKPTPAVLTSPAVESTRTLALVQPGPSYMPVNPSVGTGPITTLQSANATDAMQNVPGIEENTREARSSGSERIPPNGPASQVPYTAFRLAYPDFQANKNDFIRALLCLKQISKNKSIARFLYDDFVRVFCRDYMHYITLDRENQETLTAAKWYNQNVKTPLYLKGLLTPENLQEALDQYPSEAESLRSKAKEIARSQKDVDSKAVTATPLEAETVAPTTKKSLPKPSLIVSTAPKPIPQQGPSHAEIVSDPIDISRPAARSPLRPTTANSGSTRDSAIRFSFSKAIIPGPHSPEFTSVSKAITPHPHSPEYIPVSPSIKENQPLNRSEWDELNKWSTSRQQPEFKVHIPAPAAPPPPPPLTSKANQHRSQQKLPVVAYSKKHSLPADLLRSTGVPLSQQSNAESIAEPKPKKRKANRDADGLDHGFARYLERRAFSSTPAPPGP
ncbi:hypothetical protein QBC37DRAFT_413068 [Rhypophila decipiens]|uniref:Uncharacterized protein n=1 Tax=Rhypophila decipiens TaxID=261697 RepID=A0AAN6YIG8_9PEZI|nr:hypothetical protein QBC37DRAFT_413068 [Rhypophila decipiens]